MSDVYMGQIMAECDCDRDECRQSGKCIAEQPDDSDAFEQMLEWLNSFGPPPQALRDAFARYKEIVKPQRRTMVCLDDVLALIPIKKVPYESRGRFGPIVKSPQSAAVMAERKRLLEAIEALPKYERDV